MTIIVPDGTPTQDAKVIAFPTSCREYLGAEWGYCPARAEDDIDGRGFCAYHYSERLNYWTRPVAGRA